MSREEELSKRAEIDAKNPRGVDVGSLIAIEPRIMRGYSKQGLVHRQACKIPNYYN